MKILIILGHPARERQSLCEALALAYKNGAAQAGHEVEFLKISALTFDPILHEGYKGDQKPEPDIVAAQAKMLKADHWVIVYPLWEYMIPALLKGFFERTLTKGFAYDVGDRTAASFRPLKGKTVRIIQTMGMPEFFYRWRCGAHGAKALKSMLNFMSIAPVRATYCGMAEDPDENRRKRYLAIAGKLGKAAV